MIALDLTIPGLRLVSEATVPLRVARTGHAARRGDRSHSTPPPRLSDSELRAMVLALSVLSEVDAIAGLRARSRDPREHPGTGGEQRDAAAALDAAHDRGALGAARVAWERYARLSPDAQRTAWWLAQRGGAVRAGALVGVKEWAEVYGRFEGPVAPRETAERSAETERAAGTRYRGLRHLAARGRLGAKGAAELDTARSQEEQARAARLASVEVLRTWGITRFEALASGWRATCRFLRMSA